MGELKSAFERAMEKASKLGSLSSEEMKKQKEKRLTLVGRAIAEKYLNHGHTQVFKDDIDKYTGGDRDIICTAAMQVLVQSIRFDEGMSADSLDRVVVGLLELSTGDKVQIEKSIGKMKNLLKEFSEEQQRTLDVEAGNIDKAERDLLGKLGITGSAVGKVNLEASPAWVQIVDGLRLQYNAKLEPLKRELSQTVV